MIFDFQILPDLLIKPGAVKILEAHISAYLQGKTYKIPIDGWCHIVADLHENRKQNFLRMLNMISIPGSVWDY